MKQPLLSKTEQREAIGLLSVGSFLEAFDLWLYVHMAVLLNELFFPKTDPFTTKLLSAFAFCSTFVFRPFGALLFGYIGDNLGRKATVVITTTMMAAACLVMAMLPTYAEIGITASWIVILCRVTQGLSALGERVGAELYLTETIKPPLQYVVVGLIFCAIDIGALLAIGTSALVTAHGFNWRWAFLIGAVIAMIGSVARTRLKETPEFADARGKIKKDIREGRKSQAELDYLSAHYGDVSHKTSLAYFLTYFAGPLGFYLIYIHCGDILKSDLGCTPHQVLSQNFVVCFVQLASSFVLSFLGGKIYPLNILKFKSIVFLLVVLGAPGS